MMRLPTTTASAGCPLWKISKMIFSRWPEPRCSGGALGDVASLSLVRLLLADSFQDVGNWAAVVRTEVVAVVVVVPLVVVFVVSAVAAVVVVGLWDGKSFSGLVCS